MDARTILRWFSAKRNRNGGFTRIELLAVLMALTLLAAMALPVLAASTANSQIAQCLNNLRQMGRAVQMWGTAYNSQPSWQTFDYDGGTRPPAGSKPGNVWVEFAYLSNELVTPRILACPADLGVKIASEFSDDASHGYMAAGFRSFATSYFLNLHTTFEYPRGPLFGDRNVRVIPGGNCEFGVNNAVGVSSSDANIGWTNAVHGFQGNIVRVDGTAEVTSSAELRDAFGRSDDRAVQHLLRAR